MQKSCRVKMRSGCRHVLWHHYPAVPGRVYLAPAAAAIARSANALQKQAHLAQEGYGLPLFVFCSMASSA